MTDYKFQQVCVDIQLAHMTRCASISYTPEDMPLVIKSYETLVKDLTELVTVYEMENKKV